MTTTRQPDHTTQWKHTLFPSLYAPTTPHDTQQETVHKMKDLLRAGIDPHKAWTILNIPTDTLGIPYKQALNNAFSSTVTADAIYSSCILAKELGSSLATALEAVEQALHNEHEIQREHAIALAGPITSARILQALPLVGMFLAMLLGASPLTWFLNSIAGIATATLGTLVFLTGRLWTRRLINHAQSTQQ